MYKQSNIIILRLLLYRRQRSVKEREKMSEAIFVARYNEFDDQCRQIWSWILAACVFDIAIPVIGLCGIRNITKGDDEPNNIYDHLMYAAKIGTVVIMIWSNVTYYNINASCQYFWTSQAPQLWTFITIHYCVLWLCVGYIGGTLLMYMLIGCAALFAPKEKKAVMRQKSKMFNTISAKLDPESV